MKLVKLIANLGYGSRKDVQSFARAVAARGYVVAAVSYRLLPASPGTSLPLRRRV